MFKYIDILRKKPEMQRRSYAFGITVILTLVVVGSWAGLAHLVSSKTSKEQVAETTEPGPLSAVSENLSAGYKGVVDTIAGSNPFKDQAAALGEIASSSTAVHTDSTATTSKPAASASTEFDKVIISEPEL